MISAPAGAFEAQLGLTQNLPEVHERLSRASLVLAAKREGDATPLDILAAAQADYARLLGALYDSGYFGPVISIKIDGQEAATIPPLARLTTVSSVELRVDPGPAFRLGRADIGPLAPGTELPQGFAPGQSARTTVIGDAARAGTDGWRAISHAKAQVTQQNISANHPKALLDVQLGLTPGPKVTFGKVHLPNESRVRDDRIRRIAGIPVGKPFDPVELEHAATRLRRAGAFSSVTINEAETLNSDNSMDIDLALVDAKRRRFGFGAELQSVEGLTLSAFWLHRNLLGGAERFKIEGEISGLGGETEGVDYTLRTSFTRPATFNSDTDLYVLAEVEQLDEPLFFSRQANVEFGISHFYSDQLEGKIGLGYRFSDVNDQLGERNFTHLVLPFSITWDKRDDKLSASKGFYLAAEGLPFLGLNNSSTGARGYVDARGYQGVGPGGLVLAGRLQFGTILGSSIAQTPPDLLFLSGGSGTVRGQSFQSLAVQTGTARTGGRSFVGIAGEARIPVTDTIGAVAFYDAGFIGANSWLDGAGSWHSGAGLGLRYQTGIGPVRLDVGAPVTGRDTSGFELYLGIGQAF